VATLWPFPEVLPQGLTARTWAQGAPGLAAATAQTLLIAVLATGAALVLVLGCLEAEARFGLRPGQGAMGLLYLPLIVPQIAFLPGLGVLAIGSGAEGSALAVAAAHLVFVLPYVFLSLSAPWRAWDARIGLAGAALGASDARVFWRLRLPMLLRPVGAAAAVGLAVSIGQYLPTLLIGGGRVVTLTTEAVALSSGGNRRIIGATAVLQTLLPAAGFALALALPAILFRNRRGMQA
jgi:putative thiamine transport system permease protein